MPTPFYKRRKLELTAHPPRNCWKKFYGGKLYYFRHPLTPEGYDAAIGEWHDLKLRIENEGEDRRKTGEEFRQFALEVVDAMGGIGADSEEFERAFCRVVGRYEGRGEGKGKAPKEAALSTAIDLFLTHKETEAKAGALSLGRWESIRCHLQHFQDWAEAPTRTDEIAESTVSGFHVELLERWGAGRMTGEYAEEVFNTARQFIEWAWSESYVPNLPRNLRLRRLSFDKPKKEDRKSGRRKKKQIWQVEEIRSLLAMASDRTKLYILLALNCGFRQADIATLEPDEYKKGRIKRPRHKTGVDLDLSFKLWTPTRRLLDRFAEKGKLLLLNEDGKPLVKETIKNVDGTRRCSRIDNIRTAFKRVAVDRLKIKDRSFTHFRSTGASKLAEHKTYRFFAKAYLCQVHGVADEHYIVPSQSEFDEAIDWLGQAFGI